VNASLSERRFYVLLIAVFAGIALVLAAVGIFGVLSYLVTQRTREIGIRVALGADRAAVVSMVLRQALGLAGVGVSLGVVGAAALTGVMRKMLFDLSPTDPVTFVAVALTLFTVAVAAAWIPARRATGVDPVVALRND